MKSGYKFCHIATYHVILMTFFFICTVSTKKKKKKGEVLLSVTTGGDLQLWDETGNLLCKQDKDCRLWLSLAIGEQSKSGLGESQPFENSNKN